MFLSWDQDFSLEKPLFQSHSCYVFCTQLYTNTVFHSSPLVQYLFGVVNISVAFCARHGSFVNSVLFIPIHLYNCRLFGSYMLLMCCLYFLTLSPLHMLLLGKGTFTHTNIVARSHFGGLLEWKKCLLISGSWHHYIIAGLLVNGLIYPLRKGAPCISLILWPSVSCHLKRNEKQRGWFWVWFQCFARFRDIELFLSSAFILGNRTPTIVGGLDLLS